MFKVSYMFNCTKKFSTELTRKAPYRHQIRLFCYIYCKGNTSQLTFNC